MLANNLDLSEWASSLAKLVVASISEFREALGTTEIVVMLDLGCYPSHGSLGLSALTKDEAEANPELVDPAEAAAWKYYNFSHELSAWKAAAELGAKMNDFYRASVSDRDRSVRIFLKACANAMAQPSVLDAVNALSEHKVRVTIVHPDSGEQFFVP